MKILLTAVLTLLATLAVGAGIIHGGGLTNFAADEPHAELINRAIAFTRERFIAARSADVEVPALDDSRRIADGAAHYVAMCSGCHLGPGVPDTEIRLEAWHQDDRDAGLGRDARRRGGLEPGCVPAEAALAVAGGIYRTRRGWGIGNHHTRG